MIIKYLRMSRNLVAYKIILVFGIVFLYNNAYTASIAYSDLTPVRSIGLEINSDAMLGFVLSYSQRAQNALWGKDFLFQRTFGFPALLTVTSKSFDSMKLSLGAGSKIIESRKFGIIIGLDSYLITQKQVLGTFFSCGLNLTIIPGFYFKKGYVGLHSKWLQNAGTYIMHSDYVKSSFEDRYSNTPQSDIEYPKDGVYLNTATRFNFGLTGGFNINKKVEMYLTGGVIITPSPFSIFLEGMTFGQLPFYAQLGCNIQF